MMAEFILMVAIGSEAGNDSEAHEYIKNHIPETPKETRCLHKEHINLPEDFKHKYIIDSCKIKRDCDGED